MLLRGPLNHPKAIALEPQNKIGHHAARGASCERMDEHRAMAPAATLSGSPDAPSRGRVDDRRKPGGPVPASV